MQDRDMPIDAIVAGAGIWGCTVARRLAETGRKVLVLEKRSVVDGNMRCECVHRGTMGGKTTVVIYCGNHV